MTANREDYGGGADPGGLFVICPRFQTPFETPRFARLLREEGDKEGMFLERFPRPKPKPEEPAKASRRRVRKVRTFPGNSEHRP